MFNPIQFSPHESTIGRFITRPILRLCLAFATVAFASFAFSPPAPGATRLFVGNLMSNSVESYNGATGAFRETFVASGSGGLSGPQDLAFGPDGNLYVTSHDTNSVKRYDGETGAFIDDFVPSGSGGLANPDQLIFHTDGKLYVSSRFAGTISRYDAQRSPVKFGHNIF